MEGISVEYFQKPVDKGSNETEPEFQSCISDDNEQDACYSHAYMIIF